MSRKHGEKILLRKFLFLLDEDSVSRGHTEDISSLLTVRITTDTQELQLLHFLLFLGTYPAALLANGLIITAVACDHRLHTPMYFFLLNLSLLDLGSISTTVPKSMANSLWNSGGISYLGLMSYDCYVAICRPLHYGTLLDSRACLKVAAAAWDKMFQFAPHSIWNLSFESD
ncbi:PREDICTED: olfactory receptor 14J1-like [Tinamus guttatus]|uniref:olfactory receptor 14J1-like n=1 Tax=Tinamus guttatus TaxID=94827 RepID=UPI00052EDAFC|nr:PREDICTED: olfactory receptor 14J1-like [Tinamus guttatus]